MLTILALRKWKWEDQFSLHKEVEATTHPAYIRPCIWLAYIKKVAYIKIITDKKTSKKIENSPHTVSCGKISEITVLLLALFLHQQHPGKGWDLFLPHSVLEDTRFTFPLNICASGLPQKQKYAGFLKGHSPGGERNRLGTLVWRGTEIQLDSPVVRRDGGV